MTKEQEIQNLMKKLSLSRAEAEELWAEDNEVEHMEVSQVTSDLTPEQKKNIKSLVITTSADKKQPTVYKFDNKKKRKENPTKQAITEQLRLCMENMGATDINVTNVEREFDFMLDGVKYKVTLALPRK